MVEALGVDLCVCNPSANQSRRGSARRRAPEQDRHGVREAGARPHSSHLPQDREGLSNTGFRQLSEVPEYEAKEGTTRRLAGEQEARLLGDEPKMFLVAIATRRAHREDTLVDPAGLLLIRTLARADVLRTGN